MKIGKWLKRAKKNKIKPVILIAAGGTGGHIFPALAIAKQMQTKNKSANIVWLGSKSGMENRLIATYPLLTVSSVGIRGKSLLHLLKAPFLLLFAFGQTLLIFIKIKPNLVLGMGSFTSGIAGVVAWLLRIPLVIHEQNAIVGSTNRILSKLAIKTYQAFDKTFANNVKAITVGNPIAFNPKPKQENSGAYLNILVIGGSLGAKIFNETIAQLTTPLNIVHQSGSGNLQTLQKAYKSSINQAKVLEFIDDMASLYAWADVVICRAGAMTVSELMLSGSAAILVPFPYAIDDHQSANAKILSDNNAAILLPQQQLSPERLDKILSSLSKETIKTMASNAKKLSRSDSAALMSQTLLDLIA